VIAWFVGSWVFTLYGPDTRRALNAPPMPGKLRDALFATLSRGRRSMRELRTQSMLRAEAIT